MAEGQDPETGRFLPGNSLWQRGIGGTPRKFETADELRDACIEYFRWVEENPLYSDNLVTFQGCATHEPLAKMRAMTQKALCLFIGVSPRAWQKWKDEREDLVDVIEWADAVIYCQKFEGAAADMLNGSLIARELGLADKREFSGAGGGPVQVTTIDPSKLSTAALAELLAARDAGADE